jgi:hypothetical protein
MNLYDDDEERERLALARGLTLSTCAQETNEERDGLFSLLTRAVSASPQLGEPGCREVCAVLCEFLALIKGGEDGRVAAAWENEKQRAEEQRWRLPFLPAPAPTRRPVDAAEDIRALGAAVVRAEGWDEAAAPAFGALVVDLLALVPAGDVGDELTDDAAALAERWRARLLAGGEGVEVAPTHENGSDPRL